MSNINSPENNQLTTSHSETLSCDSSSANLNYSLEEERIKSFITWPVHYPVDPLRLAKAGFYYSGLQDEVICFSCQGHIKDWNYGDIVQRKHSIMFPNCDFVNARSNNIPRNQSKGKGINPVLSDTVEFSSTEKSLVELMKNIDYDKLKYSPQERYMTFEKSWPLSGIDPATLAQAGFFYLGVEDKVQCPFCYGVVSSWKYEDDPLKEHKRHFPWCDFFSRDKRSNLSKKPWFKSDSEDLCGNIKIKDPNCSKNLISHRCLNDHPSLSNFENLGVHPYKSPAHPQQSSSSARLRSFVSWPVSSPVSKEALAKAGFFYTGIDLIFSVKDLYQPNNYNFVEFVKCMI